MPSQEKREPPVDGATSVANVARAARTVTISACGEIADESLERGAGADVVISLPAAAAGVAES